MQVNVSDRVEALRTQGVIDFFRDRFQETVKNLMEVQKYTGQPLAEWYLSQGYYYSGQPKEAEAMLRELSGTTYAGTATRSKASLATLLAKGGRKQEARQQLNEALHSLLLDHHASYSIGSAFAQLGDKDQAVVWLTKSVETGFPCYPWYQKDPLLDPLRDFKPFQQLVSQLEQQYNKAVARYTR
ncbi:hypothetical protein L0156_06935 [bacterium]|nr:hypothetical protein [bacterium]